MSAGAGHGAGAGREPTVAAPTVASEKALELQKSAIAKFSSQTDIKCGNESTLRILKDASTKFAKHTVRVFYAQELLKPSLIPKLITDVPLVATNGDSHITLQNGSAPAMKRPVEGLLSYKERRLSRKKVIASMCKMYVSGGYRTSTIQFDPPRDVVMLTTAGAQFEMPHLEAQDFIIFPKGYRHDEDGDTPLFPHYFHHCGGKKVTMESAHSLDEDKLAFDSRPVLHPLSSYSMKRALDRAAFLTSMIEDCTLVATAFNSMVREAGDDRKGWMKATAIGMGYFAQLYGYGSLAEELMPVLLEAWRLVLTNNRFPHIGVIEFPDFSGHGGFTPAWGDEPINGVRIVKGVENRRDLLLWTSEEADAFILGALNAGDCYCIPGNEFGYCSVEAMLGDNTDLRVVQNYIHNPLLLDERVYVPVSVSGTWELARAAVISGGSSGSFEKSLDESSSALRAKMDLSKALAEEAAARSKGKGDDKK